MGQMGATLAHELNQPLTAITNYVRAGTRMLEAMDVVVAERVLEVMDKAAFQALRAGKIIRHLRQFVEKHETERRNEDINNIVEEASTLALLGTTSSGITVRIELGEDTLTGFVDRIQIQQVVVNLVRNAVEAMAPSQEKLLTVPTNRRGAWRTYRRRIHRHGRNPIPIHASVVGPAFPGRGRAGGIRINAYISVRPTGIWWPAEACTDAR
jgi:C4-dicarboxylate-specific signal transduction histidine kinase